MAALAPAPESGAPTPNRRPKPTKPAMREVRILMLHGFTQSGPLFRLKTRALEKLLAKALAPAGLRPVLFYPTAPLRLSARDVPGWDPAPSAGGADEPPEAYAWFHHDRAADTYRHLDAGVRALAAAMRDATRGIGHGATATHGTQQQQGEGEGCAPVDGVIGFSMGGCMAGMLAAALEPHRAIPAPPSSSSSSSADWAALRAANAHRPLAFAVEYSGFAARPADLQWLYAPRLATPTLHYVGALDTVVEEARTRALAERCEGAVVVVHPGGHHVPVAREWVLPLAGFVKKCVEEREAEGEKERERERVEGDHGGGMC